jgi:four helix bundle protein
MHNFKELKVWQLSRNLVKEIYEVTSDFPSSEKYGLVSQIRRCTVSVPTNIAEGSGRNTDKDFAHFLNISLGSAYELETLLILSFDVNLINEGQLDKFSLRISEIQKMTFGLIKTLRQESNVLTS